MSPRAPCTCKPYVTSGTGLEATLSPDSAFFFGDNKYHRSSRTNDRHATSRRVCGYACEANSDDLSNLISAERTVPACHIDVNRAVVAEATVAAVKNYRVLGLLETNRAHVLCPNNSCECDKL